MADVDLTTESIEHLDFEPVIPCEYPEHATLHIAEEPAAYIVEHKCPHCDRYAKYPMCHTGFIRMSAGRCRCRSCRKTIFPEQNLLRIVEVIKRG
jgi:hypothetical protein